MGGEAPRLQGAAKIPITARFNRFRVDLERQMRLFAGEDLVAMGDDAGIRDAAVLAENGSITRSRIAPTPEQRAMRGPLQLEFWRSHPTISIRNPAVLDVEGVHHPVADEPVIILVAWRELRIGTVAQQRANKVSRNFASHGQIIGVGLKQDWREFTAQEWVIAEKGYSRQSPKCRSLF